MIDETSFNSLEKALEMSEEELFASIGSQTNTKLGAKPPNLVQLVKNGKKWFSDELPKIKNNICSAKKIKYILRMKKSMRTIDIATVIFTTLTPIYTSLIAVLVSAMIIHHGIDILCENNIA